MFLLGALVWDLLIPCLWLLYRPELPGMRRVGTHSCRPRTPAQQGRPALRQGAVRGAARLMAQRQGTVSLPLIYALDSEGGKTCSPGSQMAGRQRLREFWRVEGSLLEWQLPGLITRGFLAEQVLGKGARRGSPVGGSCYPLVFIHTVTVPRGPGTLEGLGSSDVIRASHTDDRDMQSSCAEGPIEPSGGRNLTAYKGLSCWPDSLPGPHH